MIKFYRWHKFKAKQTEIDGIKFPSKKQANYYQELKLRQKTGDIIFFLREVPFHLPGGVTYRCDFVIFNPEGSVSFIDVKGFRTKEYVIKKKQVEAIYTVTIEER